MLFRCFKDTIIWLKMAKKVREESAGTCRTGGTRMEGELCCCGSEKKHDICCGPCLSGQSIPDTPERLMRSRYAAFFHRDIDYLIATRDPKKCHGGP
jgi:hypothetical protein